jgi:hypothetical protein
MINISYSGFLSKNISLVWFRKHVLQKSQISDAQILTEKQDDEGICLLI